ncbi:MAG: LLM class flavin-dependent oxidoreductase [Solirubrobacteraceae bacterium]
MGLQYPAHADPAGVARFAGMTEALGYDSLFVVEDCFLSGSIALAAVALHATERLQVGIGLMPAVLRNPASTAMELATLAAIFPERLRVTFGHGVEAWMRQVGARPANRVVALEETVSAIRDLLAGQTVSISGKQTLEAASRCADGVLFPEGCGPSFVASTASIRPAESTRAWQTVLYGWLSLGDDRRAAFGRLAPAAQAWLTAAHSQRPYVLPPAPRQGPVPAIPRTNPYCARSPSAGPPTIARRRFAGCSPAVPTRSCWPLRAMNSRRRSPALRPTSCPRSAHDRREPSGQAE